MEGTGSLITLLLPTILTKVDLEQLVLDQDRE